MEDTAAVDFKKKLFKDNCDKDAEAIEYIEHLVYFYGATPANCFTKEGQEIRSGIRSMVERWHKLIKEYEP